MKQIRLSQQASPVQLSVTEEITQPLPTLRGLAFQAFLRKHGLSLREVALAANVRLLVVWSLTRGLPIACQQAARVRAGLLRLTGTMYHGGITLRLEQTHDGQEQQRVDYQKG